MPSSKFRIEKRQQENRRIARSSRDKDEINETKREYQSHWCCPQSMSSNFKARQFYRQAAAPAPDEVIWKANLICLTQLRGRRDVESPSNSTT